MSSMISVVVPAHNEGYTITECLRGLVAGSLPGELEVIVVCNGCTDDTASIARGFGAPVTVLETDRASKSAALNMGDAAAGSFPRFYVDADIKLSIETVRAVVEVLERGGALAAAPKMEVDLTGASRPVRAFYEIWKKLPYHRHGMIGSGVYALSEAGRARFDSFPDIIADDGYVRALFSPEERLTLSDCSFTLKAPRRLTDLVKIKTRSRLGRYELRLKYPELDDCGHVGWKGALWELLRYPRLWPSCLVYGFVVLLTSYRARRQMRALESYVWERDDSTRGTGA